MALQRRLVRKFESLHSTRNIVFRRVFHRVTNHLNRLFGGLAGEYSFPPEGVGFHLTNRCNLRCKMCFLWAGDKSPRDVLERYRREEMSTERWLEIVDELARHKPSIGLSGGEPFLFEGAVEIIRRIKQKGMYCSINTNGMLLEKFARDLVETKVDIVRVSIDGPPDIHDEIRGVSGCFERLMRGIEAVNQLKSEKASSFPVIEAYFTMTNQNFTYLTAILEIIENRNIHGIKFIHPIYMSKHNIDKCVSFLKEVSALQRVDYITGANIEHLELEPERLIPEIEKVRQRRNKLAVWFFPNFRDDHTREYYTNHDNFALKLKGKCKSLWFSTNIKPNGDVEPCPDFSVGNVRREKFLTVWNCEKMRNLRKLFRKRGIIPLCHACCNPYRDL
jgi:radical SAM protein with 4Fe4S-binding SPASM domain